MKGKKAIQKCNQRKKEKKYKSQTKHCNDIVNRQKEIVKKFMPKEKFKEN